MRGFRFGLLRRVAFVVVAALAVASGCTPVQNLSLFVEEFARHALAAYVL